MNIFAPPKPRTKSGPDAAPAEYPRVPTFEEVRVTTREQDREVTSGPAAVFDWGAPLPPMTMQEIAAQEPAEWETTGSIARNPDPTPDLRAAVAMELACYEQTNYVLDDIGTALDRLAKQLAPLTDGTNPNAHAARMVLTARFAEAAARHTALDMRRHHGVQNGAQF